MAGPSRDPYIPALPEDPPPVYELEDSSVRIPQPGNTGVTGQCKPFKSKKFAHGGR